MKNKVRSKDQQQLNPAIVELVQMGNGLGGTRLGASTREGIRQNFRKAMNAAKERFDLDATTT
ncbi:MULTISPECIES: hypothetical protein [Acinetobacter calcoaceticus/baumannii complex]|uniref:hypothetical protein n=1 Tax=Acinetobacter calcoaceticus/baumannii complex TaxID=909768 RepID=UPI0023423B2D|nr:hypothetical protein [Acinetobacter pittii]MDC4579626.1 hypothetical protein [Acinetobacter baumannii]MDC4662976.1 hypothetical protein [Acinetobacter baumannii]MDC4676248.1 hypothetical protein [Acinetobacter baumannii]MDC4720857.1 hypothetical protein [Acinetobacter baumannii]WPP56348.1 hypothetical protein SOI69_03500 [Acinetobacter pittii]